MCGHEDDEGEVKRTAVNCEDPVETSPEIAELAKALAKAQGLIENAPKDSTNPHFKSRYADLASIREAIRLPMAENGLAIVQVPQATGNVVRVTTMVIHESGQWIRGSLTTEARDATPQAIGSAITYLRRYSLGAFTGVAPDDDDGEAAEGRGNAEARSAPRTATSNRQPSSSGSGRPPAKAKDVSEELLKRIVAAQEACLNVNDLRGLLKIRTTIAGLLEQLADNEQRQRDLKASYNSARNQVATSVVAALEKADALGAVDNAETELRECQEALLPEQQEQVRQAIAAARTRIGDPFGPGSLTENTNTDGPRGTKCPEWKPLISKYYLRYGMSQIVRAAKNAGFGDPESLGSQDLQRLAVKLQELEETGELKEGTR